MKVMGAYEAKDGDNEPWLTSNGRQNTMQHTSSQERVGLQSKVRLSLCYGQWSYPTAAASQPHQLVMPNQRPQPLLSLSSSSIS